MAESNEGEIPLKDNNCEEIRTPKAKMEALGYERFCARVQYVFSTVNDNEFNAATTMIRAPDIETNSDSDVLTTIDVGVYVGMMGKHPVGVIQHGAGRFCVNLLHEGLKKFPRAEYLIAVGVCYGFSRDHTSLADVIIAKRVIDLGPCRISSDTVEPRGDSITTMDQIKNIFCPNPNQVDGLKVTQDQQAKHLVETIVSGPNLVDNADLKKKIYERVKADKAYGGEMEGGELLRLQKDGIDMLDGSKKYVQVIVIKAVTDYADGTKNKVWQFIGAQAAFHYIKGKMDIQPVKYPRIETRSIGAGGDCNYKNVVNYLRTKKFPAAQAELFGNALKTVPLQRIQDAIANRNVNGIFKLALFDIIQYFLDNNTANWETVASALEKLFLPNVAAAVRNYAGKPCTLANIQEALLKNKFPANYCENLGTELDVPAHIVSGIMANRGVAKNTSMALSDIVQAWFENERNPTWEKVDKAINEVTQATG